MGQKFKLWSSLIAETFFLAATIAIIKSAYDLYGTIYPYTPIAAIITVFLSIMIILDIIELIFTYWYERKKSVYEEYYY